MLYKEELTLSSNLMTLEDPIVADHCYSLFK